MVKLTIEQENWIIDFAQKTNNHDEWLDFMDFGRATLLNNQDLCLTLITDEAKRVNSEKDLEGRTLNDDVVRIFHELGFKIEMKDKFKEN